MMLLVLSLLLLLLLLGRTFMLSVTFLHSASDYSLRKPEVMIRTHALDGFECASCLEFDGGSEGVCHGETEDCSADAGFGR
jgi:hypothetical protein